MLRRNRRKPHRFSAGRCGKGTSHGDERHQRGAGGMALKSKALEGVLERAKGGPATRLQASVSAIVAGVAVGVAVYKLLRSGAEVANSIETG